MNNSKDSHRRDELRKNDDRHNGTKSADRMEREVDQARARVSETLSELSDRLSPGELLDQALGMAREHGGELGRNLGNQVKNNPMPVILTSIGISWMMMSSGKSAATKADHSTDRSAEMSSDADGSSFLDSVDDAAAKTRNKAGALGDRIHVASADAKATAQSARDSLIQFYRDQPLLAGSLGIAIGATLGALVPATEVEDDMFGEVSDRSTDAAKSKAADKYEKLRQSARSA